MVLDSPDPTAANAASQRRASRCRILSWCGASDALLPELLAYNETPFERHGGSGSRALPLRDEPHLQSWGEYEAHARAVGVLASLRERFFQLQFPIAEGMSRDEAYRRATLRGIAPSPFECPEPLELNRPEQLELVLNPTLAGRVPLLIVPDRSDFVALVRAFSGRNEPIPVPDSMGACIVGGLNNWDRIARHRERWEREHPEASEGADGWQAEFQRLIPRKELYQDRFIILSTGPYSFVPASATGLSDEEWRRLSLVIRREHECTHYLSYRVLGSMKNNVHDELIADFVGLLHAFGAYSEALALRFFGLERYPEYRKGGRLESYCGEPPLSEPAVAVVRTLVYRTVRNLEAFATANAQRLRGASGIARFALAVAELTLEELASREMGQLLEQQLAIAAPAVPLPPPRDSLWIDLGRSEQGMAGLLQAFEGFVAAHPRLAEARSDVALALDELVSNVIRHGYDDEEEGGSEDEAHLILVGIAVEPEHLELQIIDDARCFSPLEAAGPELGASLEDRPCGGLGIHLVRSLMDEIEYRRCAGRNHLIVRKRLSRSGAPLDAAGPRRDDR